MPPTRRYTPAQREALLQAVVVDGLSVAEAVRRAAAGELPSTAAFKIPYQSASTIVNKGREAFSVSAPDRAHAALDRAALKVIGHALRTADKLDEDADPTAIKKAADAIFAARRTLPPPPLKAGPPASQSDETAPEDTRPTNDVLGALVKIAETTKPEDVHPAILATNGSKAYATP